MPTADTLLHTAHMFELENTLNEGEKVTINTVDAYVHGGLADKMINYTGTKFPLSGRVEFKGKTYTQVNTQAGVNMGTIDDRLLRDRNEKVNVDINTKYPIGVAVPSGKIPMIWAYYNVEVKNSVVQRCTLELYRQETPTIEGATLYAVEAKPYAMYKIVTPAEGQVAKLSYWTAMSATSTLLPASYSSNNYMIMPGDRGAPRSYDMVSIKRDFNLQGDEIPTFISCSTTYNAEINFGKSSSIGEFTPGATDYINNKNELLTCLPMKRIPLPLNKSQIVLNM